MKFSANRQNDLANQILKDLLKEKSLEGFPRETLFTEIIQGFRLFDKEWDELDREISHKIHSIKRGVLPGSSEWDVLYGRFLEELFRKKSRLFIKN